MSIYGGFAVIFFLTGFFFCLTHVWKRPKPTRDFSPYLRKSNIRVNQVGISMEFSRPGRLVNVTRNQRDQCRIAYWPYTRRKTSSVRIVRHFSETAYVRAARILSQWAYKDERWFLAQLHLEQVTRTDAQLCTVGLSSYCYTLRLIRRPDIAYCCFEFKDNDKSSHSQNHMEHGNDYRGYANWSFWSSIINNKVCRLKRKYFQRLIIIWYIVCCFQRFKFRKL